MKRTTVMLPHDLKARAANEARRRGVSLGSLIRSSLEAMLGVGVATDPLFADSVVYEGESPADLSANHDDYLYGEGA